jgi:mRNA interferase MazF
LIREPTGSLPDAQPTVRGLELVSVSFGVFEVVRVPFPFTDREAAKNRPALVLSNPQAFGLPCGHSVLAMITSASNAPWPLDCHVRDLEAAGLPAPSVVRFKLFTLDHRLVRGRLGALSLRDVATVRQAMATLFKVD